MGTVYQAEYLETLNGKKYENCTVVIESNYVAVNLKSPAPVDKMDFVIGWANVKEIKLKK